MTHPVRLPAVIGLTASLLAACSADSESTRAIDPSAAHTAHARINNGDLTPTQKQAIAEVRNATARFHDLAVAQEAGYTVQTPPGCSHSAEGAQGYHYLNPALVDATVELLRPELVMYEPGPNGQLQLIGVDYIVPLTASSTPPTLLGMPFTRIDALGVWAIHIWAWRPNPSGMFALWNPKASCAHAQ